jgi:Pyruvate/2-oxoacid:ferredoxin oxidoreductase gamma subunit
MKVKSLRFNVEVLILGLRLRFKTKNFEEKNIKIFEKSYDFANISSKYCGYYIINILKIK